MCGETNKEKFYTFTYKYGNNVGKILRKKIRCIKCENEAASYRKHLKKIDAVNYKGGKCVECGYSKCVDALEFHHTDDSTKEFEISGNNRKPLDFIKSELDKCILLCSNCHKEKHEKMYNQNIINYYID